LRAKKKAENALTISEGTPEGKGGISPCYGLYRGQKDSHAEIFYVVFGGIAVVANFYAD
jgi:hypothetical protein